MFYLHLKEMEYRFNRRHRNLYLDFLKLLYKKDPLDRSKSLILYRIF